MSPKKKLIICNWKMNGSLQLCREFGDFFSSINRQDSKEDEKHKDLQFLAASTMVICPPAIYIPEIAGKIKYIHDKDIDLYENSKQKIHLTAKNMHIALGAQNVAIGQKAQTGEVSCEMLREFGCQYVILGHSERRKMYGEDIHLACAKAVEALANGMVPIVCMGESLEIYEANQTKEYIRSEMAVVKQTLMDDNIRALWQAGEVSFGMASSGNYADTVHSSFQSIPSIVIAYEPVYAIGSGIVPKSDHIHDVSMLIYSELQDIIKHYSYNFSIIYGGSVNMANCINILDIKHVCGLLLGGASLQLEEVSKISNILLTF